MQMAVVREQREEYLPNLVYLKQIPSSARMFSFTVTPGGCHNFTPHLFIRNLFTRLQGDTSLCLILSILSPLIISRAASFSLLQGLRLSLLPAKTRYLLTISLFTMGSGFCLLFLLSIVYRDRVFAFSYLTIQTASLQRTIKIIFIN